MPVHVDKFPHMNVEAAVVVAGLTSRGLELYPGIGSVWPNQIDLKRAQTFEQTGDPGRVRAGWPTVGKRLKRARRRRPN